MTGIYVSVPVASFRKGLAREFFETEPLPPPSTCYGFLLSLVGEENRDAHIGVRIGPAVLGRPPVSTVLRTLWRIKVRPDDNIQPQTNRRPDYQQLLTNLDLILWLDSSGESGENESLENRVRAALDPAKRNGRHRFGGLSLGESTHLVNEVSLLAGCGGNTSPPEGNWQVFLTHDRGSHTLPVWVDHVGTKLTRHVTGNLEDIDPSDPPPAERFSLIAPVE